MADAFEVVEKAWAENAARKTAALDFVKQIQTATTPETKRAVGLLRRDPFYDAIFKFKTYYELKSNEGSLSDAQMAELKTIEGWSPKLVQMWGNGKLKAMMFDLYTQLKSEGIASRDTAMVIADLERKNPDFPARYRGKGRSRRRKLTRRRRITRKRK